MPMPSNIYRLNFLLLILSSASSLFQLPTFPGIPELNSTTFDAIDKIDKIAVLFVSNYNHQLIEGLKHHHHQLHQPFHSIAEVAIVNIHLNPHFSQRYQISNYPHLILFRRGIASQSSKNIDTVQSIIKFLNRPTTITAKDSIEFISNKKHLDQLLITSGLLQPYRSLKSNDDQDLNQRIFFYGYTHPELGRVLFPDFIPSDLEIHDDYVVGKETDLLVVGMHKKKSNNFPHFKGIVLYVNGESYGSITPGIENNKYMIGCIPRHEKHYLQIYYISIAALSLPPNTLTNLVKPSRSIQRPFNFLLYIASNCIRHRESTFDTLSLLKTVHFMKGNCHGSFLNQNKTSIPSTDRNKWWNNAKLYNQFRFALVMENTVRSGYITEKILNAFVGGSIPIYYGTTEIFNVFNYKSFIFYDPLQPEIALNKINYLEQNATAYLEMKRQSIFVNDSLHQYFSLFTSKNNSVRNQIRSLIGLNIYNTTRVEHHAGLFSQLHMFLNTFISNILHSGSSSSEHWIIQPYNPTAGSSFSLTWFDSIFQKVRENGVESASLVTLQTEKQEQQHRHFTWTQNIFRHVFKPNKMLQQMIEHYKKKLNFDHVDLGMHVRRGDKIQKEGGTYTSNEKILLNRKDSEKRIYILSDDVSFKKFARISTTNKVQIIFFPFDECLQLENGNQGNEIRCFITSIYLMSYTNRFIGSFSSNIGRYIMMLRERSKPFLDLDGLIENSNAWFLSNVDHCYIVEGVHPNNDFCGKIVHSERCPYCFGRRDRCPEISNCIDAIRVKEDTFKWTPSVSTARYRQAPKSNINSLLNTHIEPVVLPTRNLKFYIYEDEEITMDEISICDHDNTADIEMIELFKAHKNRVYSPVEASMFIIPVPIYQSFMCDTTSNKHKHIARMNTFMHTLMYQTSFKNKPRQHVLMGHSFMFSKWASNEQFIPASWMNALHDVFITRYESYNPTLFQNSTYLHHEQWKNTIVVPYSVTKDVPMVSKPLFQEFQERPLLIFYHTRKSTFAHNATQLRRAPFKLDLTNATIDVGYDITRKKWIKRWSRSKFCLVIRGDTPTSHSFYLALSSFCIPIIISDLFHLVGVPFNIDLDLANIAIRIKENSVLSNPNVIIDTIQALKQHEIITKLKNIQTYQKKFLYRHTNNTIVEQVIQECLSKTKTDQKNSDKKELNITSIPIPVIISSYEKDTIEGSNLVAASFSMHTKHCRFVSVSHLHLLDVLNQSKRFLLPEKNNITNVTNPTKIFLLLPTWWFGLKLENKTHIHNITAIQLPSNVVSNKHRMVEFISKYSWPLIISYENKYKSLFKTTHRQRHVLGFVMQDKKSASTKQGRHYSAKMTHAMAIVANAYVGKLAFIFADSARFRDTLPGLKLKQSVKTTQSEIYSMCTSKKSNLFENIAGRTHRQYISVAGTVMVGQHTFNYYGSLPVGFQFIAVVLTTPSDIERRHWIRSTMKLIPTIFLVGNSKINMTQEDAQYSDLIHFDIKEKYNTIHSSLPRKVQGGFQIISRHLGHEIKYILKMDHDVFVNETVLIHQVKALALKKKQIYYGHVFGGLELSSQRVHRNPKSKTYVPIDIYKETFWPAFAVGHGYLLDIKSATQISNLSKTKKIIACEDAFTGVLALELGIVPVHAHESYMKANLPLPERLCGKLLSQNKIDKLEPALRLVISNKKTKRLSKYAYEDTSTNELRNALLLNGKEGILKAANVIESWLKNISAGVIVPMK